MLERLLHIRTIIAGAAALAILAIGTTTAPAQKIICWKDAAGKVIGCGDRVPPEFQKNESKRLDSRGITRQTSVSAEEAARLKEEDKKKAVQKADDDRRQAEQQRQDTALLNTYTSEKEIEQRRDRELQVIELQIAQMKGSSKGTTDAYNNAQKRLDNATKSGKPVPDAVNDEMKRATDDRDRLNTRLADKEKEKEAITARYAQQKARFSELKRGTAAAAPPAAVPAKK